MDEDKRKHLDYLQAIISRMNANSFQLKNMAIVILSAMFALFTVMPKGLLLFLTGVPLIVFLLLDAYYLQQEKKFRAMYNDVAGLTNRQKIRPYELSVDKYHGNGCSFWESLFSETIFLFYVPLLVVVYTIAVSLIVLLNISLL
jgi:hypothetical protein